MVVGSPEDTLLFSIHTFTREFNPGEGRPVQQRPVELGVLCKPVRYASFLLALPTPSYGLMRSLDDRHGWLQAEDLQPGMPARLLMDSALAQGMDARVNDPYGDEDGPGGAVGAYGGDRPTLMIEARQDLMCGRNSNASLWRRKLLASLLHCIGDPAYAIVPQADNLLPPDWLDRSSGISKL
eukprot:COSAG02_NODE_4821_length_4938_cov_7.356760_2_plen_182_part_00